MIPNFRAWDRYEEAMTNQDGIYFGAMDHDETLDSLMNCLEERYELMQFIGLKDKNGVDIFEGDIVEYIDGEESFIGVVKRGCYIFYIEGDRDNFDFIHVSNTFDGTTSLIIVGNIYENPEFLEAE